MSRTTFLAKVRVLWHTIAQIPGTVRLCLLHADNAVTLLVFADCTGVTFRLGKWVAVVTVTWTRTRDSSANRHVQLRVKVWQVIRATLGPPGYASSDTYLDVAYPTAYLKSCVSQSLTHKAHNHGFGGVREMLDTSHVSCFLLKVP
jgi:hypothetical protein